MSWVCALQGNDKNRGREKLFVSQAGTGDMAVVRADSVGPTWGKAPWQGLSPDLLVPLQIITDGDLKYQLSLSVCRGKKTNKKNRAKRQHGGEHIFAV